MSVKVEIEGLDQLKALLDEAPRRAVEEHLRQAVEQAGACPEHGKTSTVVTKPEEDDGDRLSYDIESCCESQHDKVTRIVSGDEVAT